MFGHLLWLYVFWNIMYCFTLISVSVLSANHTWPSLSPVLHCSVRQSFKDPYSTQAQYTVLDDLEQLISYFSTFLDCADNMEAMWTVWTGCLLKVFQITHPCWPATALRAMVCWGENINACRPRVRVIKAVFVAGLTLNTLKAVAQERRRTKLNSILDKPFCSAPLSCADIAQASSALSLKGATQKRCAGQRQTSMFKLRLSWVAEATSERTKLLCAEYRVFLFAVFSGHISGLTMWTNLWI